MECNLAYCLRDEQLMLCLSEEGCMKSIIPKEKSCMCFVDLEKAFGRVPRKVLEWAMKKKGIPEVFVRSVMCLYEGVKTSQRGFCVLV